MVDLVDFNFCWWSDGGSVALSLLLVVGLWIVCTFTFAGSRMVDLVHFHFC